MKKQSNPKANERLFQAHLHTSATSQNRKRVDRLDMDSIEEDGVLNVRLPGVNRCFVLIDGFDLNPGGVNVGGEDRMWAWIITAEGQLLGSEGLYAVRRTNIGNGEVHKFQGPQQTRGDGGGLG